MIHNLIILISLIILGVLYVYAFAKIQHVFFSKISTPKNDAIIIVFISTIISSSINLIHISDTASDAMLFFLSNNSFLKGLLFSIAFFAGTWLFSFLFVRFSFFILGALTPENEIDELRNNNKEIAWLHGIILISLSFVVSPALTKIASSLIPYPKLPF
jgi:hypothetical protein